MPGGHFKAPTLSLSGEKSADYFDGLYAEKLFLATAGIDLKWGLTYPSLSDIAVKKAMIESAERIFLVADSSKIRHEIVLRTWWHRSCRCTDN